MQRAKVLSSRAARQQRYIAAATGAQRHDPSARQRIKIQQAYATRLAGLERKQCAQCWLPKDMCACDGETAGGNSGFPHTVIVYLHLKEFSKSSNTGCLLQVNFFSRLCSQVLRATPRHESGTRVILFQIVIPDAHHYGTRSCSAPTRNC